MLLESIMQENVHCVRPDITQAELREISQQVPYHHLPVARDGTLPGIISDRDVLQRLSPFIDTAQAIPQDQAP